MLIDTHCHLDAEYFPEGPEETLSRAREAGVTGFVCVGVGSLEQARSAVAIAAQRPDVWATVGVHPHDAKACDAELEAALLREAESPRVVAVGEIGLDYHYDHSPRELQGDIFRRFIAAARVLKKPIVVHTRSAPEETLAILEEEGARDVGGLIHCFSEDKPFAERALALGFYLSFSGIVTFKKSLAIQEVAAWAPADRILVETDSPYLAPVPLRGKRCEPAHVVHTARFVAGLRGLSLEDLAGQTSENAGRLLGVSAVLN
ncbi:MAG: TatD family deoxyribonuclease [Myxococcales bacterium]|nr:MAG: TatD family deoxyribonuclease [Myxococcales bacterium]